MTERVLSDAEEPEPIVPEIVSNFRLSAIGAIIVAQINDTPPWWETLAPSQRYAVRCWVEIILSLVLSLREARRERDEALAKLAAYEEPETVPHELARLRAEYEHAIDANVRVTEERDAARAALLACIAWIESGSDGDLSAETTLLAVSRRALGESA